MFFSVVLCTHNPRKDYLERVLLALQAQTYPRNDWELLIIDNGSSVPLEGMLDLSWHGMARIIRESELGLTCARLRGIRESVGRWIVFVDDDNILASDYLSVAMNTIAGQPLAGAIGSGCIIGDFECVPPLEIHPYLGSIAVFQCERSEWSNATNENHALSCGAGLCLLRRVATKYLEYVAKFSFMLDRKGSDTMSCGDTEMVLTACDMGLLAGRVVDLKITHLIPSGRLTFDYFERLTYGMAYSGLILLNRRGIPLPPTRSLPGKFLDFFRSMRKTKVQKRFDRQSRLAQRNARKDISSWMNERC